MLCLVTEDWSCKKPWKRPKDRLCFSTKCTNKPKTSQANTITASTLDGRAVSNTPWAAWEAISAFYFLCWGPHKQPNCTQTALHSLYEGFHCLPRVAPHKHYTALRTRVKPSAASSRMQTLTRPLNRIGDSGKNLPPAYLERLTSTGPEFLV